MWHDLRYSVRTLAKHPAFTAVAVVVLALGLGINTALFSVVYSIFFKPLPVENPHELAYLYWMMGKADRRPRPIMYRDYELFRDHAEPFAGMTAHWRTGFRLTADGQTDGVSGESVLANYFDVLGVRPALGRTFGPEEDRVSNADLAIVISHDLWTRRFKGDAAIVGKQVRLSQNDGTQMFTIVGVMGPTFKGVSDPWTPSDFWITFAQGPRHRSHLSIAIAPIARLKHGVTIEQARAAVAALAEEIRRTDRNRENTEFALFAANDVRMPFLPEASVVPGRLAAAMTIVVAIVLLIAAANIAGMLMARGVSRAGEVAVRLVVGASGWRIARQLLTESVLLAALGGALGLIVAHWLLALFRVYTPNRFAVAVAMESQVIALAACVCLGVGLVIGVVPAFRASRVDLLSALPGAGVSLKRRVRSRLRHWVVIPQIGLSLILLVVAAVHVRGLMKVELADLGYDTRNVVVVSMSRGPVPEDPSKTPQRRAEENAQRSRMFYRQILAAIESIPGAAAAALSSSLPLDARSTTSFTAVAQEDVHAGNPRGVGAARMSVSPGYFRAFGMRLVAGRDFDERDAMTRSRVAIVSESIAQRLWPGRSAVGRFVAARNDFPGRNEKLEWLEVIGVVNEVDPILRDVGRSPFVYISGGQEWLVSANTLIARVHGDPQAVIQSLRRVASGADPLTEVYSARTMQQMVADILYPRRLAAAILAASGLIGLLLASVGLYGVVAYSVAQRVHEIGVRAALGAGRADIMQLVIRDGVKVAVIGSTLGLMGTYAAITVTARMFVAVPAPDVITFILVPLFLTAVVLLACYIPARRAARVDPMVVLRQL